MRAAEVCQEVQIYRQLQSYLYPLSHLSTAPSVLHPPYDFPLRPSFRLTNG